MEEGPWSRGKEESRVAGRQVGGIGQGGRRRRSTSHI